MRSFKVLATALAQAAADKKGEDVLVLRLGRKNPVSDYIVIVSALSRPHLETLENILEETAQNLGFSILHRARPRSDHWRVIDLGKILVHIMTPEARDLYSLEKLHHDAARISWDKPHAEAQA
ncbi:MAG TPA: ribosome silencing factor [Elusimicrobiota bacterium]|nr:ribosome silencing factor [Elusimicrobiota bacterium]